MDFLVPEKRNHFFVPGVSAQVVGTVRDFKLGARRKDGGMKE